jgi:hypothetical protein
LIGLASATTPMTAHPASQRPKSGEGRWCASAWPEASSSVRRSQQAPTKASTGSRKATERDHGATSGNAACPSTTKTQT